MPVEEDNFYEDLHPDLLRIRAKITESAMFSKLTSDTFEKAFDMLNECYMEREDLLNFIEKKGMMADYNQYVANPEMTD